MWCLSGFALVAALSGGAVVAPTALDQDALTQPQVVTAWLKAHAKTADRQVAQRCFAMGLQAQRQGNWSRASKAFGESALFFPTPAALTSYADNQLRNLGRVRARERIGAHEAAADLKQALNLYRSALAADQDLRMLSPSAAASLKVDEACLSQHLEQAAGRETPAGDADACRPVELYKQMTAR
jgi:hypothetical protein